MMWTTKPLPPALEFGNRRTVRRFAFWPTRVDEQSDQAHVVWLQSYWECQLAKHTGTFLRLEWNTLGRYSVPIEF